MIGFQRREKTVSEENDVLIVCLLFTTTFPLVEDAFVRVSSMDITAVSFPSGEGVCVCVCMPMPVSGLCVCACLCVVCVFAKVF